MSYIKRIKFYLLLTTFLLFGLIYLVGKTIPEENIRETIDEAGVFGPLVFIFISLLTYIIAPLSGAPILYVGFYAYGQSVIFLTTIAAFLSFNVNFWIARRWGRPVVEKLAGKENTDKISKLVKNYGLATLFLLRVFQGGIHDFVSYAVGLTSMDFRPYITVSSLALVPGTALWYYLSLRVSTPVAFTILNLLLVAASSSVLFLGAFVIGKWKKKSKTIHP